MDFSWVKQLADQANQLELERQDEERKRIAREKRLAAATTPFNEKLYMLLNMCCDEFNKHCMFANLRVTITRFQQKTRMPPGDPQLVVPEEISYFTFTRKTWLYGVRGINGIVEFVQFPVSEGAGGLNLKLDELGIDARYTLTAKEDEDSKEVIWTLNEELMDGPKLVSLCQAFFSEFIHATNE